MAKDWRKDWDRRFVSPSRLKTWRDCPRKYFYNYIRHLPTPDRLFFLSGNVFDEIGYEEFRFDQGQDVEPIVQIAGDTLYLRAKECKDLRDLNGRKLGEKDILKEVMEFRTWLRSFLLAIQRGEDKEGRTVQIPAVKDTQVLCKWPIEIDGNKVTIAGYADILHEDGTVTDLKMASTFHNSMWTHGRIMSEIQWVPYSQALNTNKFQYIVTDKQKDKNWNATDATVRTIKVDVHPQDIVNFKDLVTSFLRSTDFLNDHKDGVFPPNPEYKGNGTKWNMRPAKGKFNEYDLPQNNFCRRLCDYKETCFKECFGGEMRSLEKKDVFSESRGG